MAINKLDTDSAAALRSWRSYRHQGGATNRCRSAIPQLATALVALLAVYPHGGGISAPSRSAQSPRVKKALTSTLVSKKTRTLFKKQSQTRRHP